MRSTVPSPIRRNCGPTSWSRPDLMSIPVLMPALSPTMTEGKLAKWHVKVGDAVKSGPVICEIETDKATMEVEADHEGTAAPKPGQERTQGPGGKWCLTCPGDERRRTHQSAQATH